MSTRICAVVAIAKGVTPNKHWFRSIGHEQALTSVFGCYAS